MKNNQKKYKVYKYTSPSGKIYIGQTGTKLEYRARKGKGYKFCTIVYKAIQKYGWDNFTKEIVSDGLTKKEADWLENYLIKYYHSNEREFGYNLTLGGEGNVGYKHSEETKRKISQSHIGIRPSEETREKYRQRMLGFVIPEETKQKMRESNKYINCKPVMCIETGITYYSVKDAAKQLKLSYSNLTIAVKYNKVYRGYHWRYVEAAENASK